MIATLRAGAGPSTGAFLYPPMLRGGASLASGMARGVQLPGGAPRQGESSAGGECLPLFFQGSHPPDGPPCVRGTRGKTAHQTTQTRGEHLLACNHRPGSRALAPAPSFVVTCRDGCKRFKA